MVTKGHFIRIDGDDAEGYSFLGRTGAVELLMSPQRAQSLEEELRSLLRSAPRSRRRCTRRRRRTHRRKRHSSRGTRRKSPNKSKQTRSRSRRRWRLWRDYAFNAFITGLYELSNKRFCFDLNSSALSLSIMLRYDLEACRRTNTQLSYPTASMRCSLRFRRNRINLIMCFCSSGKIKVMTRWLRVVVRANPQIS